MKSEHQVEDRPKCEICKSCDDVVFIRFKYNFLIWRCRKCRINFETPMKGFE